MENREVPEKSAKSVFFNYETGSYEAFEPMYEIDRLLKKTSFADADQYVAFMSSKYMDVFGCINSMEEFLGVEFAIHHEGKTYYESDFDDLSNDELAVVEGLEVDLTTYKVKPDDQAWPASFPCVAVYWLERSRDRNGPFEVSALEFVYPHDMCDDVSPEIHENTTSTPVTPAAGKVSHEPQEEEAEVI